MAACFVLITGFLLTLLVRGAFGASPGDYIALRNSLLANYSPEVRPVFDDSWSTTVHLSLELLSIVEVSSRSKSFPQARLF